MSLKHGVYTSEIPTKIPEPDLTNVAMPVVIGTAPINMGNLDNVNKPVLCHKYDDAVKELGFSRDWNDFTIPEFIHSHFVLYQMAPVVFINVLDPEVHKKEVGKEGYKAIKGKLLLEEGILKDTVEIFYEDKELIEDEDYLLSFTDDGRLNVVLISETVDKNATLQASYEVLDPSKVTEEDIIGGIDVETGEKTGLELVSEVFPRFELVPGLLLSPGYSHKPEIATMLSAKASNINGIFKAEALIDAPANIDYREVPQWKEDKDVTNTNQLVCWPKVKRDGNIYRMSTHVAGVINQTDFSNEGIPYVSPSNESIACTSAVKDDGSEVFLGLDEANYLNGAGIITAFSFVGGWKLWGNRTGAYPHTDDVKDNFIPVRRMFNWVGNTLILKYWTRIDDPMNKRLVDSVIDDANIWFNSLVADQYLLGGRIELLKDENSAKELMDGIIRFHIFMTPPSPAEEIDFIQEYDIGYVTDFINSIMA